MKLSAAVRKVIELAEKVRDYYTSELPRRHPHYPIVGIDEGTVPPPLEEGQLRKFLLALPPTTVYQLILIMYLGRGDFGTDDLARELGALSSTFDAPEAAVSQMMEKAPLADYLSDGLAALKKANIDVDSFPVPPAKRPRARKQPSP